ncbi:MAG: hypothetical protein ACTSRP_01880 [Candidatus Helarchaeota archaeon]
MKELKFRPDVDVIVKTSIQKIETPQKKDTSIVFATILSQNRKSKKQEDLDWIAGIFQPFNQAKIYKENGEQSVDIYPDNWFRILYGLNLERICDGFKYLGEGYTQTIYDFVSKIYYQADYHFFINKEGYIYLIIDHPNSRICQVFRANSKVLFQPWIYSESGEKILTKRFKKEIEFDEILKKTEKSLRRKQKKMKKEVK